MSRTVLSSIVAVGLAAGVIAAAEPVTRRDAARLQAKIDRINKNAGGSKKAELRTPITEAELNSYLRYELGDSLPTGVKELAVSLPGDNRVSGRAIVDLTQVAQSRKSTGMLDSFSYLGGSFPLAVNGILKTKAGVATFALESASISGMPVPAWMLQEIVSYYSKSPTAPQGVSLERPFSLPAGIHEIQLDRGQAIVVQ
ncbi:MAG: hypothetical protein EXQ55_04595 [Acidobacteria bacterium]|nr:hypothetical protein [Acidobacteriota bacterium]